jgi:tape measure domain-containing protein
MAATLSAQLTLNSAQFQGGLNRAVLSANAAVGRMTAQFNTLKNVAGLGAVGGIVMQVGQKVLDATINFEKYHRQLTIVTGGTNAATAKMKELQLIAAMPGLNLESAVYGQVRLQAMGYSAEQATAHIQTLAKTVAGFGGGGEEMKGILLSFSQISSKGQVFAEEINQIAERLPTVRRLMTEAFGTSNAEEIQKMGISAMQFTDALLNGMQNAQPVTAGVAEEMAKFKVTMDSIFADESGSLKGVITFFNAALSGLQALHTGTINLFTDIATNDGALSKLKEVQAFNAKMEAKLADARAKKDREETEISQNRKKQADDLKKKQEAAQKAASQRVTQTGLAVSTAGTDEAKLAEVNAEIKRLNIADDQLTLMKKLEDAQEGRIKLSERELQKLQTYIGYLGQRKNLEESITAEKKRVDDKAAADNQKEKNRLKRLREMAQGVREKGEALGFGRMTEEEQAAQIKAGLNGATLESIMTQLNDAKIEGKELDEGTILALEKQIELLKEKDSIEENLNKQKETAQTQINKDMVTNAMERAKMGRSERVQAIRDKGDLSRQKARAERALERKLAKDPTEELQKEIDRFAGERKVGGMDMRRALAAAEARKLMNNQFPDPAQSLDLIRKRLDALAAA